MNNIAGIPYREVEFDQNGSRVSSASLEVMSDATDVFVISHGWNNSAAEARTLYREFFTNFSAVAPAGTLASRKLAIVGIIWPSKQFDELVAVESTPEAGGGGAGVGITRADPKGERALRNKLDRLKLFFDRPEQQQALDDAKALVAKLETQSSARDEFVEKIRGLLKPAAADKEDASDVFFRSEPDELMEQLRIAEEDVESEVVSGGGASFVGARVAAADTGGAAGIAEFLQGFKTAAMNILNYTTYYEMKDRAGTVGRVGVAKLIDDELSGGTQRIHLIGHSFGGRVVTAAAFHSTTEKIRSLTLLQAAFSHNAFSKSMNGLFRGVVERQRVHGPIVVTHTKNDKAVGIAYPLASRLAGQVAAALGDANDKYGGLGRNGAQKMNSNEVVTGSLLDVGKSYAFVAGKFFNLEGGSFIKDHGNITGREVAYAAAIASLGSSG